jgi:hypothetical protein
MELVVEDASPAHEVTTDRRVAPWSPRRAGDSPFIEPSGDGARLKPAA